jgi:hypothetical protein
MGINLRPWYAATLLAFGLIEPVIPASAQYYYPPTDPCAPPGPGFAGLINQLNAAQRAQACQQARDAAMRQQQMDYAAAQAREAEAQRAAAQARALEEAKARAVSAAQAAAETSPDNLCRQPETARNLINEYNRMDWPGYPSRRVVDIEHLVTIKKDSDNGILSCHGVWVHTNGMRLEGTMTMHPNVAGDIIVSWELGHWQPPVSTWVAPQPSTALSVPASTPSNVSPAFQQGLADREAWESWFATTSGDYRNGALYWSGQRSTPHPGTCAALGGDATAGCVAAQVRLEASDSRRKREPDYRQGWNSYPEH